MHITSSRVGQSRGGRAGRTLLGTGPRRPSPIIPLACAVAIFALTQSMLNPSLPAIQADTGATPAATTWLVTVFFLVSAVSAPICGRLGDMFGRRAWLAISLGLFAAGALIAAIGAESGSLIAMIIGRAVQGMSGGIFPLALAHARTAVPPERLPTVVSVLSATIAIGAAVGVAIGGIVTDAFGYPMIFWCTAAGGALTMVLVLVGLEGSGEHDRGRIDVIGAALLSIGVGAFLLLVSEASNWGWAAPTTWLFVAVILIALPYWVRHEKRHRSPIVDLRLAREPALLRTNLASVLTGFGLFGSLVLTPQLVQRPIADAGLGLTTAQAGFIVMPTALCNFLSAPFVGRVVRRIGPKAPMVFGCLVAATCLFLIGTVHDSVFLVATWTAVLGIGTGCVFACTSSLVLEAVEPAASGQAIGVNAIARSIGSSMGTQVGGIVLAAHVVSTGGPPTSRGFMIAFTVGAAVTLAAMVISITIPKRQTEPPAPAGAGLPAEVTTSGDVGVGHV
jgi:EmrB/QacA subfamily drug resistance transporter